MTSAGIRREYASRPHAATHFDATIMCRCGRFPTMTNLGPAPLNLEPLNFESYGDLAVRVGLNLREGQRLMIIGPLANGGVSLQAAPLVRQIAAAAYRAGAEYVE